jgi:hypothetical protein
LLIWICDAKPLSFSNLGNCGQRLSSWKVKLGFVGLDNVKLVKPYPKKQPSFLPLVMLTLETVGKSADGKVPLIGWKTYKLG